MSIGPLLTKISLKKDYFRFSKTLKIATLTRRIHIFCLHLYRHSWISGFGLKMSVAIFCTTVIKTWFQCVLIDLEMFENIAFLVNFDVFFIEISTVNFDDFLNVVLILSAELNVFFFENNDFILFFKHFLHL